MSGATPHPLLASLLVGLGAAAGGGLRLWLGEQWLTSGLPWPLLLINMIGALLLGLWAGLPADWQADHHRLTLLIGPGFCGGLTTFSLFSLEWWQLWQSAGARMALIWLLVTVLLWLLAVAGGFFLSRVLGRA